MVVPQGCGEREYWRRPFGCTESCSGCCDDDEVKKKKNQCAGGSSFISTSLGSTTSLGKPSRPGRKTGLRCEDGSVGKPGCAVRPPRTKQREFEGSFGAAGFLLRRGAGARSFQDEPSATRRRRQQRREWNVTKKASSPVRADTALTDDAHIHKHGERPCTAATETRTSMVTGFPARWAPKKPQQQMQDWFELTCATSRHRQNGR